MSVEFQTLKTSIIGFVANIERTLDKLDECSRLFLYFGLAYFGTVGILWFGYSLIG